MLRKMSTTHFMLMFVVTLLDREKQLWQRELSENSTLSVLSIEHTHSEPGKDLIIPWGHDSSSDPRMTRTMVGNEDKADIADVHVAPSGSSGTQGGFCGMWRTSHSSDLPQIYNSTGALPCLQGTLICSLATRVFLSCTHSALSCEKGAPSKQCELKQV